MSQQQICAITLAALAEWAASNTKENFGPWCVAMKKSGRYWGADETLGEVPNAL